MIETDNYLGTHFGLGDKTIWQHIGLEAPKWVGVNASTNSWTSFNDNDSWLSI